MIFIIIKFVSRMSREKQREALIRERERLQMEVAELRRRLESSKAYQQELEKKNSAADSRVQNLEQQIEVRFYFDWFLIIKLSYD